MSFPVQIEIKVLTFNRWYSLLRLLDSLAVQKSHSSSALPSFSIEILDNCASSPLSQSQQQVLQKRYGAKYFFVGADNIAIARNAALSRCKAPFVAFVDDDVTAGPFWISEIWQNRQRYQSDVVLGPARPVFPVPKGIWESSVVRARLFVPPDILEGSESGFVESTANCLLNVTALREARAQFDTRFGKTGGSDFELFTRLRCLGFSFSYAPGAEVFESFPRHRLKFRWVARRAARCSGARAAILSRFRRNQYAQEWVGAFHELGSALNLFNRTEFATRVWSFFSALGFIVFSFSGLVLREYDRRFLRFARFHHPRWSVWQLARTRLAWHWKRLFQIHSSVSQT